MIINTRKYCCTLKIRAPEGSLSSYRHSHHKEKTVTIQSYLYIVNPYTGQTTHFYLYFQGDGYLYAMIHNLRLGWILADHIFPGDVIIHPWLRYMPVAHQSQYSHGGIRFYLTTAGVMPWKDLFVWVFLEKPPHKIGLIVSPVRRAASVVILNNSALDSLLSCYMGTHWKGDGRTMDGLVLTHSHWKGGGRTMDGLVLTHSHWKGGGRTMDDLVLTPIGREVAGQWMALYSLTPIGWEVARQWMALYSLTHIGREVAGQWMALYSLTPIGREVAGQWMALYSLTPIGREVAGQWMALYSLTPIGREVAGQ